MSYTYKYPRPMVTVDCLIFNSLNEPAQVLLIRRNNPPFQNMWALPGGFVDMDESLEAAALRELQEETGLHLNHLEQLHTFGKPDRDPRGRNIAVVFTGFVQKLLTPKADDDAGDAQWFAVNNLPELAFDHAEIIAMGLKRFNLK